jgi:glycosyltransferase involved in cell wall biosynthesis
LIIPENCPYRNKVNGSPAASCVISVVIPAYNAAIFIAKAIQSVLDQKMADCEILVVNDGSKDQTEEVLAGFKANAQVRLLHHPDKVNRGVCASRRLAMQEARGEFVAFLDADDVFLPGKLARHIRILREHPEVVLLHGSTHVQTEVPMESSPVEPAPGNGPKAEIYDLTQKSYFLQRNMINGSTVVCRRTALNPEEDLPPIMIEGYEDWLLWNCVATRGLFYYDPEPLSIYFIHAAGCTYGLRQKPGATELNAIEFYLSSVTRLPRLRMRLLAVVALIYKLAVLAQLRRAPKAKMGIVGSFLKKIIELRQKRRFGD